MAKAQGAKARGLKYQAQALVRKHSNHDMAHLVQPEGELSRA